jgi:hypothetical protein
LDRVTEVLDIVRRADALGQYDHNLIGMAGEIIAEDEFGMEKVGRGAKGIDGYWDMHGERRRVQVKAWSLNRINRYGDNTMFRIKPGASDDLLVLLVEGDGYQVLYSGPADHVGKLALVKGVEYRLIQYKDFK